MPRSKGVVERRELVKKVARLYRPEVFVWTKENYEKKGARFSWSSCISDQRRVEKEVALVLACLDKAGARIIAGEQVACSMAMVRAAAVQKGLGHGLREQIEAVLFLL